MVLAFLMGLGSFIRWYPPTAWPAGSVAWNTRTSITSVAAWFSISRGRCYPVGPRFPRHCDDCGAIGLGGIPEWQATPSVFEEPEVGEEE